MRSQADTPENRTTRLKSAADVLERGTEWFADSMISRLLGSTVRQARPDLVEGARRMMLKMSPRDIAQVQQGIAERPDSVPTLKTIHVPTLLLAGAQDTLVPVADLELMRHHVPRSELKVIPNAGHFAAWEQPEAVGKLLRIFVESCQ